MPLTENEFTLHQAWVEIDVSGGSNFFIPVSTLHIRPVPISEAGQEGATVVTDVNHETHYRCEGWRHDVELNYTEIPEDHHSTLLSLVENLHKNGGEGTLYIASSDGTRDASKSVDVVANFSDDALPASFSKRARQRPARLRFQGKSPLATPKDWLAD
jgi:hypothetical protein